MAANLFGPCAIGTLELQNRFVRSGTHDRTADRSGRPTYDSVALYGELGRAHIGLVITGHAFVTPLGRASWNQYAVDTDEAIPGLRRLSDAVHRGGGKIALQLGHAGTRADPALGRNRVAVSTPVGVERTLLSDMDIEQLADDFALAAARAKKAGFDAVQFHGAHGYLMSQFLSPAHNRRSDRWGGDAGNRRRFLVEVTRRSRESVGLDFPLLIKLGVHDSTGYLTLQEATDTAIELARAGIDAIEVSTVGHGAEAAPAKRKGPDKVHFRAEAAQVKRAVSVPVIVVGGIRTLESAQDVVDSGDADLISMCRPFIREPHLLETWHSGYLHPSSCISCNKCLSIEDRTIPLGCMEESRPCEDPH